jgi:hypothetical protein
MLEASAVYRPMHVSVNVYDFLMVTWACSIAVVHFETFYRLHAPISMLFSGISTANVIGLIYLWS